MTTGTYRFEFDPKVSLLEAEQSLHLAIFAAEGLFGEARVRMEVSYHVDEPHRAIVADGATEVGGAVVRMFTGLLIREFGEEAFKVRRREAVSSSPTTEVT